MGSADVSTINPNTTEEEDNSEDNVIDLTNITNDTSLDREEPVETPPPRYPVIHNIGINPRLNDFVTLSVEKIINHEQLNHLSCLQMEDFNRSPHYHNLDEHFEFDYHFHTGMMATWASKNDSPSIYQALNS